MRHSPSSCGAVSTSRPCSPSAVRVRLDEHPTKSNLGKIASYVGVPDSISAVRGWWQSLTPAQQSCAGAHELAHVEGVECERCADTRAGAILRHWGFPRNELSATFGAIVPVRPTAGADALKGYDL